MLKEWPDKEFRAIGYGLLSIRARLILDKIQREKALNERDKRFLNDAKDFLQLAWTGFKAIHEYNLNADLEAYEAYDYIIKVVKAMVVQGATTYNTMPNFMQRLNETIDHLLQNGGLDPELLNFLKKFFEQLNQLMNRIVFEENEKRHQSKRDRFDQRFQLVS